MTTKSTLQISLSMSHWVDWAKVTENSLVALSHALSKCNFCFLSYLRKSDIVSAYECNQKYSVRWLHRETRLQMEVRRTNESLRYMKINCRLFYNVKHGQNGCERKSFSFSFVFHYVWIVGIFAFVSMI